MKTAEFKKLSSAEIDYLYTFCVQHYVRDYDVQVEIVDHLTNAIEDLWINFPSLSFEKALENVYKTFGYKGFATIVQQKTIAIQVQHSKAKTKIFWSFFTWPKAAFTFMIAVIILIMPNLLGLTELRYFIAFSMIFAIILQTYFAIKFHGKNKKQKKQLLLTASILYASDGPSLLYLFFPYNAVFDEIDFTVNTFYFLSTLLYVFCITFYISITYGNAIMAKAKKEYPIAFV